MELWPVFIALFVFSGVVGFCLGVVYGSWLQKGLN